MTNEELFRWASKTADSLTSFSRRGGTSNSSRGYDLRDRFDDLKCEMITRRDNMPSGFISLWSVFCSDRGYDTRSEGFDFFA